jgi:drug/metabolite transporter (DMT)-like permease
MLFAGGISTGVLLCLLVLMVFQALRVRTNIRTHPNISASPAETTPMFHRKRLLAAWVRRLMHRSALVLALLLANGFYASFASAQATLGHIDPVVFAAMQLSLLLPFALAALGFTMRPSTNGSVRAGFLGGIPLGIGFVCLALSLHALGIIPTAMLTALDGIVASLISWLVFRQRLSVYTCLAAICAGGGAVLLWWIAPSHWQIDLVALSCGILFTLYAFHVERNAVAQGSLRQQILPFLGGAGCSMAATSLVLALCFGRWESLQTMTTADGVTLLYCGLATVLIPQVIVTILLRSISAVTLAFLAVLEPLMSIGFASLWGKMSLNLPGWCGVSLILLSLFFQAQASRPSMRQQQAVPDLLEPAMDPSSSRSVAG